MLTTSSIKDQEPDAAFPDLNDPRGSLSWALVTGGSGRGGSAISRALHARGLSIVIHHSPRSLDEALGLQRELEGHRVGSVKLWSADLTAGSELDVPEWLTALDVGVLVCNASAYQPSNIGDAARFQLDFAIHVTSHVAILAALRPSSVEARQPHSLRSVVAVTDISVDRPPPGHLAYITAKGALQTLMLALANEWAPHVRVNVVQPGTLPFPEDWSDQDRAVKIVESIPLRRIGRFDELASAVAYLALDASYVTGQVLAVDGGRSRYLL